MASVPPPPANFGQRLLPSVVDDTATATPSRILYSVPRSRDIADGFIDITAQDFARAVDRCAWHLEESLGPANPGAFPTLLYMGAQDVVYAVVILACIKTGYKVLLSSPRNTLEAHLSLLEQTACNSFLVPPNFPLPVVKQILAARKMTTVEIPGIQHWLDTSAPHRPYPYTKTYAAARLDPWVVLHTSGSTGLPKPIVQTHATYSPLDSFTSLPSLGLPPTYPALCAGKRVYLAFPLFHCAGVMMLLPASILGGFTVVLGLFPPSPDAVDAVHLHGNVQESCLPPSTLVDLARNPAQLENLRRLHHVTYGGGPLPTAVGDLISTRTTLLNVLGTTEAGVLPHQVCSSAEDWSYMQVSPALGAEYREVSEGLYEQVIVRKPELAAYQGVFGTFPDLHEWPMKDLYKKHPTREGLWLYSGRIDDVIVFSTGEKLNPVDMESSIESHPAVSAALISGNGQFQAALLVETKGAATEAEEREILDDIWPSVQAANKVAPSHGIIHRDMILLTRPDKPMLRAGKGTVQRRMTLELYAAELEALYQANAPAQAGGDNQTLGAGSCKSIQEAVLHIVSTSTGLDLAQYSHDTDLFELGMDSLQVTAITKDFSQLLSSELGRSFALEPRNIYSHPSMRGLVDLVTALAKGEVINETTDGGTANLEKLYQNLATLVSERPAQPRGRNDSHAVLLTGSTGSLGSYVLESLAQSSQVHRIYCLNRGLDSLGRQEASQAAKGLSPLSPKVKCLDADLSKPFFGLSKAVYKELLKEVTLVIHNAWQVDFNLATTSFTNQVTTVARIAEFSSHSTLNAHIFFISSISAVASWTPGNSHHSNHTDAAEVIIPERIFSDWHVPQATGYGQSKFLAERVLDAAARDAGVPARVCRVGQIAGPIRRGAADAGEWPKREWLPSLMASSKYLGRLPASLGRLGAVDWIPVDVLGESIVELALAGTGDDGEGAQVYHAVNPARTEWAGLLPVVVEHLGVTEVVPLEEWVAALRRSAVDVEVDVSANPAVKILDFYEDLVTSSGKVVILDTTESVKASPTLAGLGPVELRWMETWLKQWAF